MGYKSEMIGFRCSPAERGLIEAVAGKARIPVAELCRSLVLPAIRKRVAEELLDGGSDTVTPTAAG